MNKAESDYNAWINGLVSSGVTDVERLNFESLYMLTGLLIDSLRWQDQWEYIVEADTHNELAPNLAATLQDDLDDAELGRMMRENAARYAKPIIQEALDAEVERRKEPVIDYSDGMDSDRRAEARAINAEMRANLNWSA